MNLNSLTKEAKQIVYDLACAYGCDHYSTLEPFEIDYKFWEDIGCEHLVCDLAEKLAKANARIKELEAK